MLYRNIKIHSRQIEVIDEVQDSNSGADSRSNKSLGEQKPKMPFFARFLELAKIKCKNESMVKDFSDDECKSDDLNATHLNDSQNFCISKALKDVNRAENNATLRSGFSSNSNKNGRSFSSDSSDHSDSDSKRGVCSV